MLVRVEIEEQGIGAFYRLKYCFEHNLGKTLARNNIFAPQPINLCIGVASKRRDGTGSTHCANKRRGRGRECIQAARKQVAVSVAAKAKANHWVVFASVFLLALLMPPPRSSTSTSIYSTLLYSTRTLASSPTGYQSKQITIVRLLFSAIRLRHPHHITSASAPIRKVSCVSACLASSVFLSICPSVCLSCARVCSPFEERRRDVIPPAFL